MSQLNMICSGIPKVKQISRTGQTSKLALPSVLIKSVDSRSGLGSITCIWRCKPNLVCKWSEIAFALSHLRYDFFRPTAYISQTANSRFLLYKNKASKMVNYVVNEAVDKVVQAAYADHRSRAHLMWSLQHQDDGCVYPLNSGKCGYNNEFGSWNPAPFNEFLRLIKSKLPHKSQGVYHYDFLPYSMIPEDMHQCLSNGCS